MSLYLVFIAEYYGENLPGRIHVRHILIYAGYW